MPTLCTTATFTRVVVTLRNLVAATPQPIRALAAVRNLAARIPVPHLVVPVAVVAAQKVSAAVVLPVVGVAALSAAVEEEIRRALPAVEAALAWAAAALAVVEAAVAVVAEEEAVAEVDARNQCPRKNK